MDFTFLTKSYHALSTIIDNAKKEAEESKILANNALAGTYHSPCFFSDVCHTKSLSAMEPLIDSDATLKRAADTKAILRELQDDLAACMSFSICLCIPKLHVFFQAQRVTDLLRDKLYNQSALLVEARDRIRELEEEKRSLSEELLQRRKEVTHNAELLVNVGRSLASCR